MRFESKKKIAIALAKQKLAKRLRHSNLQHPNHIQMIFKCEILLRKPVNISE